MTGHSCAQVVNQTSEVADSRPVSAAAFAPRGGVLATGAWSGKLRLWRVSDAAVQLTVQAHDDRITGQAPALECCSMPHALDYHKCPMPPCSSLCRPTRTGPQVRLPP